MAGYWMVDGKRLTDEEYEEYQRRETEAKERVRQETADLVKRLGETYAALTSLLRQNPGVGQKVPDAEALDQEIYAKLRRNLERADQAPRCRWIKEDGTWCGGPRMRNHIYCYAHTRMMEARAEQLSLPALEDANAIQMAVMLVQRALIDDEITEKKAGLLLYSLQIAAANIDKTTFGQAADKDLVTETTQENDAIVKERAARGQNGNGTPTTEAQRHREERQGLPLMNADDTDPGSGKVLPQSADLAHIGEEARAAAG